jgi:hypothetical protein
VPLAWQLDDGGYNYLNQQLKEIVGEGAINIIGSLDTKKLRYLH